ncbi:formylglycine-generating enzyme family protein [Acanthopleuribacter pedis]|uniref:Formylglycine-generating enzyme family protein n=1 Tax=Acanthopleuribacter pedis TaxID=442870 RepID=A0A8J7U410_9BACT|nr:formylglycine-generating enzyme family protein [Acanthopleuribacter pedis]MBO1321003.1 formylglycine-generating enzyme family protein [Acanthopleuribacter pedis]
MTQIPPRGIAPPDDFPYPSTQAYGRDAYGIWQTIAVKDVEQTFRWCSPGRFTMGSPATERHRGEDEVQREITLSRGFWLADTACPQALWSVVMGTNPTGFRGDQFPVASVSYDDLTEFFGRWRVLCPDFPLRLPTEAEWEYACRAGTTTPFSFGETINTEQVNFYGGARYLPDEPDQEYRGETVAVKALPCNPWGLYQRHGNVDECCSDWYGSNDDQELIDPSGPPEGGLRVVRGGGFDGSAGGCRSAYRSAGDPGGTWRSQGFRPAGGS